LKKPILRFVLPHSMLPLLQRAGHLALDTLFPPRCCACPAFCAERFCPRHAPTAIPLAPPFCRVCAEPFDPLARHHPLCRTCREAKHSFDVARSAWIYDGAPRDAIHRFKYGGKTALAARLAPAMADLLLHDETLREHGTFDYLVPVPLHARRQRKRGYNQSELLANALARQIEIPARHLLERTRATRPQVGLNAKARGENVRGAFSLYPRFAGDVRGSRVLLVDDVFTTGSTLRECAAVLQRAGAQSVCALTLARQISPDLRAIFEIPAVGEGLIF